MDLLGEGCGGVCTSLALARGGAGGVLLFMIKQKIITDKMRYSNLSNNMMISEL
jgi:lantibiotic modifying enzyme